MCVDSVRLGTEKTARFIEQYIQEIKTNNVFLENHIVNNEISHTVLIIIAFSFMGELLHYCLPLPIPASIYGIVLLFMALELKWIKVKDIRETSSFLIAVMPVMFIPAAVGLIDSWSAISNAWLQYVIVTIVSTFVVMGVSGVLTQYVIRKGKEKKNDVCISRFGIFRCAA